MDVNFDIFPDEDTKLILSFMVFTGIIIKASGALTSFLVNKEGLNNERKSKQCAVL